MEIREQSRPELIQLGNLIQDATVAMLTCSEGPASLVSRPMTPLEMDDNGAIWFFVDQRSVATEAQLRAINLSFSDHSRSSYVSITGHAVVDHDRARMTRLWTPVAKPWFPDGPESLNLALLKVVPESADYWDGPHSTVVRILALASSIAAGKPLGLGEHGRLDNLSARPGHGI